MKTGKLVIGILSIVLFLLVALQSCAAGLGNTLADNGEVSGSADFLLALGLLVAGIINICTRKGGKGGYVAAGFYILPALLALPNAGSYADLYIWAVIGIAFGVFSVIATSRTNRL
ncbi:hypothetical protein [Candidatus Allofournierella merdipullorum]|uniref:hypothetical protein n=1 Tax=Candidatus Allofournierella merdipullorum TaxID=2838595 RepID=UPI003AB88C54